MTVLEVLQKFVKQLLRLNFFLYVNSLSSDKIRWHTKQPEASSSIFNVRMQKMEFC